MPTPFDLARALRELARQFRGWHHCGRLIDRRGHCPACGAADPSDVLALEDRWIQVVPQIWQTLDSASRSGFTRERVRAALEDALTERRERHR